METNQPSRSPELQGAIENSVRLSDLLHNMLGDVATLNAAERFAMAQLSISLHHREAILLLVTFGANTSATALQRPLLEAFVTGVWFENQKDHKNMPDFLSLKRPQPKFETMAQTLRKTHELGEWFEILRDHYDVLGDYAHGHRRQLSRWLRAESVEPQYSDGQMVETLHHSNLIGLMAAIHREKISKRPIERLLKITEGVMKRCEYPR